MMRDFWLLILQLLSLGAIFIGVIAAYVYLDERYFMPAFMGIFWLVYILTIVIRQFIPSDFSMTPTIDTCSEETVSITLPNYKKPNIARRLIHKLRR